MYMISCRSIIVSVCCYVRVCCFAVLMFPFVSLLLCVFISSVCFYILSIPLMCYVHRFMSLIHWRTCTLILYCCAPLLFPSVYLSTLTFPATDCAPRHITISEFNLNAIAKLLNSWYVFALASCCYCVMGVPLSSWVVALHLLGPCVSCFPVLCVLWLCYVCDVMLWCYLWSVLLCSALLLHDLIFDMMLAVLLCDAVFIATVLLMIARAWRLGILALCRMWCYASCLFGCVDLMSSCVCCLRFACVFVALIFMLLCMLL